MTGLYLMLTTKTANLNAAGGGVSELQPMDIAAAISYLGLSEFETMYVRARILDAEEWGPGTALELMGWIYAQGIFIDKGWTVPRGSYLVRKSMFLVMNERINPAATICKHCSGGGAVKRDDGVYVPCKKCATLIENEFGRLVGNGRQKKSDREYGQALGVDHKTYAATWQPRLKVLRGALLEIEQKARHLPGVVYEE